MNFFQFLKRKLINEVVDLDVCDSTGKDGKSLKDYERTSLNPSILLFKKFLNSLEGSWRHKRIAASGIKKIKVSVSAR